MKTSKKILLTFFILVLIFGVLIIYVENSLYKINKDEEISFNVELGEGLKTISKRLEEDGLIKNSKVFYYYARIIKMGQIQAGTFNLNPNMGARKILENLNGSVNQEEVKITFQEGINFHEFIKKIEENTAYTKKDVLDLLKDKVYLESLIKEYDYITEDILNDKLYFSLEGYLFPDTYYYFKNSNLKDLIKKPLDKMASVLKELEITEEFHNTLTLASIIEKEAFTEEDMLEVGGIFKRRIAENMPLGSCVTTYYGAQISQKERDLKISEINDPNPYNTRCQNSKDCVLLPVGPISFPSVKALKVAKNSKPGDYLYFVSDKNRKIYPTKTYEEHQRKIAKLKKEGLWFEWNN